jgi:hypothetical protein
MLAGGLPSAGVPSDHIPVEVVLRLLPIAAARGGGPPGGGHGGGGEVVGTEDAPAAAPSAEEMRLIADELVALHLREPEPVQGKPNAEEIAALKAHAGSVAELRARFGGGSGVKAFFAAYVKALKRNEGKRFLDAELARATA